MIGLLVVAAAIPFRPDTSFGLDRAQALAAQPYGTLLLIVVAVGFGAPTACSDVRRRNHRV
ncbi:DUF1206 domain-containing protein [Pseudonocardia sp. 73-21]|uniref:DUF1206 domain-containing protein n=1 Tax=unclassified Pseudonocardia TaxID=2619320 RepID=UPI001ACD272C|nr:DUF1206 domain-containing protein [Pseudonocardia sp.]